MVCRHIRPRPYPPGFPAWLLRPIPLDYHDLVRGLESTPRGPKLTKKKPKRTKLGAMGEYYRAFVVTEEPVTKWPAKRDEVEYDVLRVSVNMRTN